jgi:hypothetical protein
MCPPSIPPATSWSFGGYTCTTGTTQATIYFNGQSQVVTLTAGVLTTTTGNSFIGYAGSLGNYLSGIIDDVRIYNRAEVQALYNAEK